MTFKKPDNIILKLELGCLTILGLSEQYVFSAKQVCARCWALIVCETAGSLPQRISTLWCVITARRSRGLSTLSVGWKELPSHRKKKIEAETC